MKTQEIADFLSAELVGDGSVEIVSVAGVRTAAAGEIAFTEKAEAIISNASCVIVPHDFSAESDRPYIRVPNPKLAFALVAEVLHPAKKRAPEIHPTATIAATARVGKNVFVGAFTCIGEASQVGDNT